MALRLYGDGNIENVTSIATSASVTLSHSELASLSGVTGSLKDQINSKASNNLVGQARGLYFSSSTSTSTTNTTFRDMKSFTYFSTPDKLISVGATMWNNSGSDYWTWRMYNNTKSYVIPLLDNGSQPSNYVSTGGGINHKVIAGFGSTTHSPVSTVFVIFDVSNSDDGDTFSIQMSNSNGNGSSPVTSTQQLNIRSLKVFNGVVTGISGTDGL